MVKKIYVLSEKEIKMIEEVRKQYGFLTNDSAAIRYVISEYVRLMHKELENDEKVTLAIVKDIESNILRLLDAANTVLITNKMETCIPVNYVESPVFTKSREYEKEKKAHLKEKKDYKNKG